MRLLRNHCTRTFTLFLFVSVCSCLTSGYSVLTHEQVVDLMWKDQIQPLLLKRFPGPRFKAVNFKIPTQQTEDMYIKRVNATVENYTALLQETANGKLDLPNRDCDTGRETRAGEYVLTDKTYARLIDELAKKNFDPPRAALHENLLQFYSDPMRPSPPGKTPKPGENCRTSWTN